MSSKDAFGHQDALAGALDEAGKAAQVFGASGALEASQADEAAWSINSAQDAPVGECEDPHGSSQDLQTVGRVAADAREALRHDISEALASSEDPGRSRKLPVAIILVTFTFALVAALVFGFSKVLPGQDSGAEQSGGVSSEAAEGIEPNAEDAPSVAGASGEAASESADQDPLVGHWGVVVFISETDEESETDPSTFFADFNADGTASITSNDTTVYYVWNFALETENEIGMTRNYTLEPNDGTSEDLFVTIGVEEGTSAYNMGVISNASDDPSPALCISK